MSPYRLWMAPLFAWYSAPFYAHVAHSHRGIGAALLLSVLLVFSALDGARLTWGWLTFVQDPDVRAFITMVPEIRIEGGVAHSPVEQPWVREYQDREGVFWLGLDTTGQLTDVPGHVRGGVLMQRETVLFHENGPGRPQRTTTVDLDDLEGWTIDPATIDGWLTTFAAIGIPLLVVVNLLFSFTIRLAASLGVGAGLWAILRDRGVGYAGAVRLAVVGALPTTLLTGILALTGLADGWWFFVWWGLYSLSLPWWFLAARSATAPPA